MSTKHFPLVMVAWLDHQGDPRPDNWRTIEEVSTAKPCPITSVGWLVHEAEDHKVLVSVLTDDHFVTGVQIILSKAITKITNLEEAKVSPVTGGVHS